MSPYNLDWWLSRLSDRPSIIVCFFPFFILVFVLFCMFNISCTCLLFKILLIAELYVAVRLLCRFCDDRGMCKCCVQPAYLFENLTFYQVSYCTTWNYFDVISSINDYLILSYLFVPPSLYSPISQDWWFLRCWPNLVVSSHTHLAIIHPHFIHASLI